ncbi:hypothetical protein L6452_09018 [Arctium lappa]|uniref:Uncharacterized protein n=1 Tax=Arctium lappa TaxID=4217 RepID=A0ACB9DJN4_ARCLA|nr:hypothetical protein L6452_09018 [Arctium lappa]
MQGATPYMKIDVDCFQPLLSDCWDRNSEQLDEYPGVTFPGLSSLDGYLRHRELTKSLEIKCSRLGLMTKGKSHVREHMENFMSMLFALLRKMLTISKPIITPGDRMVLLYVLGLDFIDTFFYCLRAKVLPVPVLPPDPLQEANKHF